jgi:DNA-3-methyladenine glycosylase II
LSASLSKPARKSTISATEMAEIERHLSRRCPVMKRLIKTHGSCTIGRSRRDPFHVLCTSIISQQLSVKAADTIQARVATAVLAGAAEKGWFMPAHFIEVEFDLLRSAGLSNAKAKWLIAIAQKVHSGEFSFEKLHKLDDEAAIEALDALPGIGRWTAEMYLMFALARRDLFALDDVGLRNGVNRLFNDGAKLDDAATLAIAERWRPYRSIASWYLWRAMEAAPKVG